MSKKESSCMLCGHTLPAYLHKPLRDKFLCTSCWNKEKEKVLEKLISQELQRRGLWNPSER